MSGDKPSALAGEFAAPHAERAESPTPTKSRRDTGKRQDTGKRRILNRNARRIKRYASRSLVAEAKFVTGADEQLMLMTTLGSGLPKKANDAQLRVLAFDEPLCRERMSDVVDFVERHNRTWLQQGAVPKCYAFVSGGIVEFNLQYPQMRREASRVGLSIVEAKGDSPEQRVLWLEEQVAPSLNDTEPTPHSWPHAPESETVKSATQQEVAQAIDIAGAGLGNRSVD